MQALLIKMQKTIKMDKSQISNIKTNPRNFYTDNTIIEPLKLQLISCTNSCKLSRNPLDRMSREYRLSELNIIIKKIYS